MLFKVKVKVMLRLTVVRFQYHLTKPSYIPLSGLHASKHNHTTTFSLSFQIAIQFNSSSIKNNL
jgi:hypothetical protein